MGLGSLFGFSSSSQPQQIDGKHTDNDGDSDSDSVESTSMSGSLDTTTGNREGDEGAGMITPATSTYPVSALPDTEPSSSSSDPSTTTATKIPPSYLSPLTSPPPVTQPYTPSTALSDLPCVHYALETFLSSRMLDSEKYMREGDEEMERMYFATGFGLIQCVKGLMSYEDEDLLAGIQHTKRGNYIASLHRKKHALLSFSTVTSLVSTHAGLSVSFIEGMTEVERHAELTYAESLFEKALLGIVYSGDWLAFIKEALNMRTTIGIYRALGAYLEHVDAQHPAHHDPTVDEHFRSGVYLGMGMCNIILSLMPGKLAALVELFGYKGDRRVGLEWLMRAGGWSGVDGEDEPTVDVEHEGVRRSICDMALLIFHLVLSSFTFDGVSTPIASKILSWNLKRYPNGVFFLFGAGRLALMRSQPSVARGYYERAMEVQKEYRNLHHISFWEMAIAGLALWDVQGSLRCWRELEREATWSKAIYSYGMAVCLLETSFSETDQKKAEKAKEEAGKLMGRVPGLRQKIAGKSIPLEKFVARKARKYQSQSRLLLPALELAYTFQGIAHAPRGVIVRKMLPEVDSALNKLGVWDEVIASETASGSGEKGHANGTKTAEKEWKKREKAYYKAVGGAGEGYWDDYCLAMFLRGVCLRYVAYPDPDAEPDPTDDMPLSELIPQVQASRAAENAFKAVFEYGPKIELDHHIVYHAHYEYGRLLANIPSATTSTTSTTPSATPSSAPAPASTPLSTTTTSTHVQTPSDRAALEQFELILSGKYLEVGPSGKKGKYSMENALAMRTHAAVDVLGKGGRL